ncbi:hypothetical protein KZ843_09585 [Pseudomonas aeruginosa]|nr:hypothetical protein [Pseudomonas aeruginosa]MBW6123136.1 hypothetical protein [Pseudomonas aeruginosa]
MKEQSKSCAGSTSTSGNPCKNVEKISGVRIIPVFLFGLYFSVSLTSLLFLRDKVPVTTEDLVHASWSVTGPSTFMLACTLAVFFVTAFVTMIFSPMITAFLTFTAATILATTLAMPDTVVLRSAILPGDAKVGCNDYASQACTDMSGLVGINTSSVQSNLPMRQQLLPIEFIAFVRAPFDAFHADRLNQVLDQQRAELKKHLVVTGAGSKVTISVEK